MGPGLGICRGARRRHAAAVAGPAFSVQPAFGAAGYTVGQTVTFTEGTAGPSATLTVEQFDLGGVDKRGELVGTSWDSSGEAAGTISLRVRATNSGGTVLSAVVTVPLTAAATVPGTMAAPAVAGTGSSVLTVDRAVAPPDGGSPITGYEMRWSTDQATWTVGSMTTTPDTITGLSASTLYYVQTRALNAVGPGAWSPSGSATTQAAGDVTAPVLTAPTATATGPTSADLTVTTDEGNGTLYWVATAAATAPTGAQIKAGTDHAGAAADAFGNLAVTSAGTKTASTSSLTPATTRYVHFLHEDASLNPSTVATTAALALPPVAPVLTGPLTVSDPAGDTSYSVDVASRQYWALFPSGTSWVAADILTGAGAADFGAFDVASGTVNHSETFNAGLDLTGATLAFVARVEGAPPSALSNTLTATVTVNTMASGPTPVSAEAFVADNAPTLNVTKPASATTGDYWILVAFVGGSTRPAVLPAGFAQMADYASGMTCRIFQRVIDGSEAASITLANTLSQFTAWNVLSILYRGGTGVGVSALVQTYTAAGAVRTAPAITLTAGSDLLTVFAQSNTAFGAMTGQDAALLPESGNTLRSVSGRNAGEAAGTSVAVSITEGASAQNVNALSIEVKA